MFGKRKIKLPAESGWRENLHARFEGRECSHLPVWVSLRGICFQRKSGELKKVMSPDQRWKYRVLQLATTSLSTSGATSIQIPLYSVVNFNKSFREMIGQQILSVFNGILISIHGIFLFRDRHIWIEKPRMALHNTIRSESKSWSDNPSWAKPSRCCCSRWRHFPWRKKSDQVNISDFNTPKCQRLVNRIYLTIFKVSTRLFIFHTFKKYNPCGRLPVVENGIVQYRLRMNNNSVPFFLPEDWRVPVMNFCRRIFLQMSVSKRFCKRIRKTEYDEVWVWCSSYSVHKIPVER